MSKKKKNTFKDELDSMNPFSPFQGIAKEWVKGKDPHKLYLGTVLQGAYSQFFMLSQNDQEKLLRAYSLHFLKKHKSVLKNILPLLKGLIGNE